MLSRARDWQGQRRSSRLTSNPINWRLRKPSVAAVLDLADGGVDYAFVVASVSHLTEEAIRMMCKGETNHSSGHVSSHFAIDFFEPTTCGAMLPERQLRGRHQFPAVSYAAVLNQESAIFPWHGGSVLPVLRRYA